MTSRRTTPRTRRPAPDEPTFTKFYRDQRDGLLRFVRHYGGPYLDAEDIVAEAFTRAYVNWTAIENPRPWLLQVAMNLTHQAGRRSQLQAPSGDPHSDHESSITWMSNTDLPSVEWGVLIWELGAALQRLPGQQRAAVLLEYDGWSRKEISVILRCTTVTVRGHIHRGRAELKKLLDEPVVKIAPRTGVEGRPA